MNPGEYYKQDGTWYAHVPTNVRNSIGGLFTANLARHEVVENPDGTITVQPSILVEGVTEQGNTFVWHGYLDAGKWREC